MTYRNHFHWVKISKLYITYIKFIKAIHINYKIITKIHLKIQYTLNNFLKSDLKLEKELPKYKITENMTISYTYINLSLKVKQYTRKIFALNVISKCYFFLIYKEK